MKILLNIVKKIIGAFSAVMCLTSIVLSFSYSPVAVFIIMGLFFGFVTFLCYKPDRRIEQVQKTTNEGIFPDETIRDLKHSYRIGMTETVLRIINESFHIMQTTSNIETLCSRYEVGLKNCYTLKELEEAGIYSGKQTADYFISMYVDNYFLLIKRCFVRYLSEVKTEKGKQNRTEKFWNIIKNYTDEYTLNDIQEYIYS